MSKDKFLQYILSRLLYSLIYRLLVQFQPPAADGIATGPGAGGEPGTAGGARPLPHLQAGVRSCLFLLLTYLLVLLVA